MQPGSVLAQRYRLIAPLGRGGMGSVWRAEHLGLQAAVAVKLLAPELDGRQDSIARFLREAQSAASLRSPHVVQVFDHGLDEPTQTPFIAMELMEGESLAERLTRVNQLSPAETSKLITQAARALTRAQELGIVHRDLKPANLFLVRNEDDEILKVLDFGLVKWRRPLGALTHGAETATDQVMGTPYYMSPEQMSGSRDADHRSDLWALGVIAFECMTGTRPYEGDNLISIALKVCGAPVPKLPSSLALPAELEPWFARALAKEPEQRFQSAREMADELRRVARVDSASLQFAAPGPTASALLPVPEGGRTVPLPRLPLTEARAEPTALGHAPLTPLTASRPEAAAETPTAPSRRAWAWTAGAIAVGLALLLIGVGRNGPSSTAGVAPANTAGAPGLAAEAPVAPAADPASRPSNVEIVSAPGEMASSLRAAPPRAALAEAAPSASPRSNTPPPSQVAPGNNAPKKATRLVPARTPSSGEPRAVPSARSLAVDIERLPTF